MENNISRSTIASELHDALEASAEPYVGMPVYLDDSFFKFVSEDIELDCISEEDMTPDNWSMPPNGEDNRKPENSSGGGKPDTGNTGMENSMDCVMNCPLAMAYVPWQGWGETYEPEKGFMVGTMFPCLNFPFLGGATK